MRLRLLQTQAPRELSLAVRRTYLIVVLRPVPRPLPAATRRCCSRRRTLGRYAEEQSKYYQLHLHRSRVPLAAMHLGRVGVLAVAWRRRRTFWPLLRRLRLQHIALAWPPASTPRCVHVRTLLIVLPRPVPRMLPAATRRCSSRRRTLGR
jgi:hypothetical protein